MAKWYVTVDRYCSHCDDPNAPVWTVSRDPNDIGWETDSGCPGYGLTKNDAEELANAANRVKELEKYQSIHAQCDQINLETEATLVRRLADFNSRIEQLESALRHYSCGCKENECEVKPKYAPLKCGWPARQALEGK